MVEHLSCVGLVAIGRNEGDRLIRCLKSVVNQLSHVVYVDSGSTDGSSETANSLGVTVVELDLSIPFTAARARNAGFRQLVQNNPHIKYVQFVDGDCEVVPGWLETAYEALELHPDWAVVCGRRRERSPQQSLYNQLCDIEWDTPIGEALACGGDSMMRVEAVQQVNGFNPDLIAGEEPELCVRLRQHGWIIWRLDAEMTLHDAQMTKFHQWWRRSQRAGYAYAEGSWRHGRSPQKHWLKESRRIWLWGAGIPLLTAMTVVPTHGWSLLLLLGYPLSAFRSYRHTLSRGFSNQQALQYGIFCTLGKFPEAQGQIQFHLGRLRKRKSQLIEYKGSS